MKLTYNQSFPVRLFNYCYLSVRYSAPFIYLISLKYSLISKYQAYKDNRDGIESYELSSETTANWKSSLLRKEKQKQHDLLYAATLKKNQSIFPSDAKADIESYEFKSHSIN